MPKDPTPPEYGDMRISELIRMPVLAETAKRNDLIGLQARTLLEAEDKDEVIQRLIKEQTVGLTLFERRDAYDDWCEVLGIDRASLKGYLKAKGVINQTD